MKETESQKARIRKRYKGIDLDELDVIPAISKEDFYDSINKQRVAVYARVSTDDPKQTSSYELQKNHYKDLVSRHPDWNLVGIYADEGISGTSLQHRDAFINMIKDCQNGKIDLIVTKSVARFARNILDCIGYVRQLAFFLKRRTSTPLKATAKCSYPLWLLWHKRNRTSKVKL